jgi:hypothetical protein
MNVSIFVSTFRLQKFAGLQRLKGLIYRPPGGGFHSEIVFVSEPKIHFNRRRHSYRLFNSHLIFVFAGNESTRDAVAVLVKRQIDRHRATTGFHHADPGPEHISGQQRGDVDF